MRVMEIADRLVRCVCVVTCEVYIEGTLLYKGNVYNLPYHILKCSATRWDMNDYHAIIHIEL